MTGMLEAVAMAYLTPMMLAELKRQVAAAGKCPLCGSDPVLMVRHGFPTVYTVHPPDCRERPQLTLVKDGAS